MLNNVIEKSGQIELKISGITKFVIFCKILKNQKFWDIIPSSTSESVRNLLLSISSSDSALSTSNIVQFLIKIMFINNNLADSEACFVVTFRSPVIEFLLWFLFDGQEAQ
jgi:hypothetical protein